MKRSIVLSIVLLTIIAASAYSQTTTQPTVQPAFQATVQTPVRAADRAAEESIHFGFKAGTNLFKLSGKSFDDNFKFGYSAGVYAEKVLKGRFGLQAELIVNEAVARTSDQFGAIYPGIGVSFQNTTLNYISLPILLTFKATDAFTILLGPQYGYMFYQTQGVSQTPLGPKDAFKKNDFSAILGAQLRLSNKMQLGARYLVQYTQLNNIDDNSDSWKLQGLQLYVMFKFK
jgi:opacity protein-like surface antigen